MPIGDELIVTCKAMYDGGGRFLQDDYIMRRDSRDKTVCRYSCQASGEDMSEALTELLFWIVAFLVFFFGFKWLQDRKKRKKSEDGEDKQG